MTAGPSDSGPPELDAGAMDVATAGVVDVLPLIMAARLGPPGPLAFATCPPPLGIARLIEDEIEGEARALRTFGEHRRGVRIGPVRDELRAQVDLLARRDHVIGVARVAVARRRQTRRGLAQEPRHGNGRPCR